MSLFCAVIHGMRGKSVCREGLSDKMPPSRRAIQGNSCKSVCRVAKCAAPAPFLPATHGIVSKSVCRGGMEHSVSLFCAAIHGMLGKSVCRGRGCVVQVPDSLRDTEICSGKCVSQVVWLDFRGGYGKKKDVRKRKRS